MGWTERYLESHANEVGLDCVRDGDEESESQERSSDGSVPMSNGCVSEAPRSWLNTMRPMSLTDVVTIMKTGVQRN